MNMQKIGFALKVMHMVREMSHNSSITITSPKNQRQIMVQRIAGRYYVDMLECVTIEDASIEVLQLAGY